MTAPRCHVGALDRLVTGMNAHRERGSIAVEAAILIPGLLIVLGLVLAGGRTALAHQTVDAAAADAARAASIARTAPEAHTTATTTAVAALTRDGLQCARRSVTIDTSGFATPVGTPAAVRATVTCVVPLSDLAVPGAPGSVTVTATATSPLDTYRERR